MAITQILLAGQEIAIYGGGSELANRDNWQVKGN